MNFEHIAKELFDTHNDADALYFTSDGQAFFNRQMAANRTEKLKDKTVTDIYRDADAKQRVAALLNEATANYNKAVEEAYTRAFPVMAAGIRQRKAQGKG